MGSVRWGVLWGALVVKSVLLGSLESASRAYPCDVVQSVHRLRQRKTSGRNGRTRDPLQKAVYVAGLESRLHRVRNLPHPATPIRVANTDMLPRGTSVTRLLPFILSHVLIFGACTRAINQSTHTHATSMESSTVTPDQVLREAMWGARLGGT